MQNSTTLAGAKLSGNVIVTELVRNMELGAFEMAYSTLLPCVFSVYLNPDDHTRLCGIYSLIAADARRALSARVAKLNSTPSGFGIRKKARKDFRIAAKDWVIEFYADTENAVPAGDVEIHSELNDALQPGYRGVVRSTEFTYDDELKSPGTTSWWVTLHRPPPATRIFAPSVFAPSRTTVRNPEAAVSAKGRVSVTLVSETAGHGARRVAE